MMKAAVLMFAASAVLLVGGGDEALKKEQAKFKGMWKIARFETAKGDDDNWKGIIVVFDGKAALELRKDGDTKKSTYKINAAAKPKEIDITHEDDDTKVMKGVYTFDKDTLKICIDGDPSANQRPAEFAVKDGTGLILVTLERMK
jgi:uncharacterized protein (TIGR03067 family)